MEPNGFDRRIKGVPLCWKLRRIFETRLGTGTQEPQPLKPVTLAEQLSKTIMSYVDVNSMYSIYICIDKCSCLSAYYAVIPPVHRKV